jgi:hypothetical protein
VYIPHLPEFKGFPRIFFEQTPAEAATTYDWLQYPPYEVERRNARFLLGVALRQWTGCHKTKNRIFSFDFQSFMVHIYR